VDGLFVRYQFTFQYACRLIKEKGYVCWDDMEAVEFRESNSYDRIKNNWNGGDVYSLYDSPDIAVEDVDKNGMNIYVKSSEASTNTKKGFFF